MNLGKNDTVRMASDSSIYTSIDDIYDFCLENEDCRVETFDHNKVIDQASYLNLVLDFKVAK